MLHLLGLADLVRVAPVATRVVESVHKLTDRLDDALGHITTMLALLLGGVDAPLLTGVGAEVEEVRELLGLEGVAAGDTPQLSQHLAKVLVDEVALLAVFVAEAENERPLGVLLEPLGVRRLLEDRLRLDVRDDLLRVRAQLGLELGNLTT